MEKKIIFLELPIDIVEKIDEKNTTGDRSVFISDLIEKQLHHEFSKMTIAEEMPISKGVESFQGKQGDIRMVDNKGKILGTFNINTMEGFQDLTKKIHEISNDPIVRMRVRRWQ